MTDLHPWCSSSSSQFFGISTWTRLAVRCWDILAKRQIFWGAEFHSRLWCLRWYWTSLGPCVALKNCYCQNSPNTVSLSLLLTSEFRPFWPDCQFLNCLSSCQLSGETEFINVPFLRFRKGRASMKNDALDPHEILAKLSCTFLWLFDIQPIPLACSHQHQCRCMQMQGIHWIGLDLLAICLK